MKKCKFLFVDKEILFIFAFEFETKIQQIFKITKINKQF